MNSRRVLVMVGSVALIAGVVALIVLRARKDLVSAPPAAPAAAPLALTPAPNVRAVGQPESEPQAIERIRRLSARKIDSTLPDLPLEKWLASVLPPSSEIRWHVTDCGEQTGDPAVDSQRSIPVCVTASTKIGSEELDITISTGENPGLYFMNLGRGSDALGLKRLSSLPTFWRTAGTPAETAFGRMRWIRGILDVQERDANAWWQLQEAAESLAKTLPALSRDACYDENLSEPRAGCPGVASAEETRRLGIGMEYCWSGEAWIAGNDGYAKYLELWPSGPHADVAFWRTRIEPPCCDECGPEFRNAASRKQLTQACREFIAKFPKSNLRKKADACEVALKETQQPELIQKVAGPHRTPVLVLHFMPGEGTKILAASRTVESFALSDERGMYEVARVRLVKDQQLKWSEPRTLVFRFGEAEVRPNKTDHEVTLLELKDQNLLPSRAVRRTFAPGERLELIAYAGEGYLNARYKGEYLQIFGEDLKILRAPDEEVWVLLENAGEKSGWVRLDNDAVRVVRVTF